MKRIYNLFVAALAIAACGNEGEELASGSLSIDFSSDRESARVGETVTFTAIVSGGTAPYTYAWDFGDGITSDEESPEIIYEEPGVKMISLDVTDADGRFSVRAVLQRPDREEDYGAGSFYLYKVTAEVTGAAGETQVLPAVFRATDLVARTHDDEVDIMRLVNLSLNGIDYIVDNSQRIF